MLKALFASLLLVAPLAAEDYEFTADSLPKPDVPKGKVTRHDWKSQVFEGTLRQYYLYVPAQYDGSKDANVIVFQDGHAYVDEKGLVRATTVLDNLHAQNETPLTVGIFINPGLFTDKIEGKQGWQNKKGSNRAVEYDTLSPKYAEFLEKEILPEVSKTVKLTTDPARRAICGMSSGGICAFTVAWERPDLFKNVISHIGSFTNIRGGHVYPALIRKSEKRDIRVFLQDGDQDGTSPQVPRLRLQIRRRNRWPQWQTRRRSSPRHPPLDLAEVVKPPSSCSSDVVVFAPVIPSRTE